MIEVRFSECCAAVFSQLMSYFSQLGEFINGSGPIKDVDDDDVDVDNYDGHRSMNAPPRMSMNRNVPFRPPFPKGLTGPIEHICRCPTTLHEHTQQSLDAEYSKCGRCWHG